MAKIIIGLVGQIASGKGTATKYLEEKYGAGTHRFSTMLRDVLKRLYLETSRENMQSLSTFLRKQFGEDALARVIAKEVADDPKPVVAGHGAPPRKAAAAASVGLHKVPFVFRPGTKAAKVSVAGTFNDWTVGKSPLAGPDADGEWSVTMLLATGTYQYKFVVGDDGWTQDKTGQDGETDDGYGGKNSVRNVDDRYPKVEVKRGDGNVYPDGVTHAQGANEVNNRGAGRVEFTARAHAGAVWAGALGTENIRLRFLVSCTGLNWNGTTRGGILRPYSTKAPRRILGLLEKPPAMVISRVRSKE